MLAVSAEGDQIPAFLEKSSTKGPPNSFSEEARTKSARELDQSAETVKVVCSSLEQIQGPPGPLVVA